MPTDYRTRLQVALEETKTPRRALARMLSERTGGDVEKERRAIYKYLDEEKPQEPEAPKAALIAEVLGRPELALVQTPAERQAGRRRELEARVAKLEEGLRQLGPDLGALASLPERVLALEQRDPPKTGRAGRGSKR